MYYYFFGYATNEHAHLFGLELNIQLHPGLVRFAFLQSSTCTGEEGIKILFPRQFNLFSFLYIWEMSIHERIPLFRKRFQKLKCNIGLLCHDRLKKLVNDKIIKPV